MYYWGRIEVANVYGEMDLLHYREKSMLLLPDRGEENRFAVISGSSGTQFLIGSTSLSQFNMLKSFFSHVYNAEVRECGPPEEFVKGRILLNSRRNRRKIDFHYPSFMQNIVEIPSLIPDVKINYQTVIRTSVSARGRKRFNFAVIVGYTGNTDSVDAIESVIMDEVSRLRKRYRWKFRIRGKNSRVKSYPMTDSFCLSSFVGVLLKGKNA